MIDRKVVLIGDIAVGKTALIDRIIGRNHEEIHLLSVGCSLHKKKISTSKNEDVCLTIFDTPGQTNYLNITEGQLKSAAAVAIVFDLTQRNTFSNLSKWAECLNSTQLNNKQILIIGNKVDKDDILISDEEIKNYTEPNGYDYIKTSAKTGDSVREAFQILAEKSIQAVLPETIVLNDASSDSNHPKKRSCCS